MNTQKIQHRLGNYQILGLLSYGSTSNVFKISELPQQNLSNNSNAEQSPFNLITIDMTYYRQKNNEKEPSPLAPKKDLILKLYNLERMLNKQNQFLQDIKYDILVEIIFLTYLHHPGIVQAKQMLLQYQNIYTQNGQLSQKKLIKAGIVMEICEKGCFNSLNSYINRTKVLKQSKVKIMKFYLAQIAHTLMYLNNECKILHRDLKAENIMVNKQLDIKVIDYGISKVNVQYLQKIFNHPQKQTIFNLFGFDINLTPKILYGDIKNHENRRKNLIGSKHYISPELVQKYRSDMELIDEAYQKTDIWSFGVLMYRIFHDKYPFDGRNLRQILDLINDEDKQVQIDEDLPQQVKDVLRKCLKKDYSTRASWDQIVNLQFFSEMPINEIFITESPIISILEEHKKQKPYLLSNVEKILFDEKFMLKYEDHANKKRRILLVKQKSSKLHKMLILKQKQSVSLEILLNNSSCLKITKESNYLQINFLDNQQSQALKIYYQSSKEQIQKLIDSINQVLKISREQNDDIKKSEQCIETNSSNPKEQTV